MHGVGSALLPPGKQHDDSLCCQPNPKQQALTRGLLPPPRIAQEPLRAAVALKGGGSETSVTNM